MTEYLLPKPDKTQFVQQLDEEDFQDRAKCCCHYWLNPRRKTRFLYSAETAAFRFQWFSQYA